MSWHILTRFYESIPTWNMAVCTPDKLNDGETGLIPDDMSSNEWNPRLDEEKKGKTFSHAKEIVHTGCMHAA